MKFTVIPQNGHLWMNALHQRIWFVGKGKFCLFIWYVCIHEHNLNLLVSVQWEFICEWLGNTHCPGRVSANNSEYFFVHVLYLLRNPTLLNLKNILPGLQKDYFLSLSEA